MERPSYGTTKRQMGWSFALSWGLIYLIVVSAIYGFEPAGALAPIVIPSMIVLIATLLGIHRFSGSMDFQAMQASKDTAPPPAAEAPSLPAVGYTEIV